MIDKVKKELKRQKNLLKECTEFYEETDYTETMHKIEQTAAVIFCLKMLVIKE